ncbi:hypothetical protein DAEQUDRAFT_666537 [Daedalea quercina L-15889]|uniref:Uncharacterized protein n=1 Tax=Daedalea quercina L-15889 TaxID=1314783 RepID=A0A165RT80_9APHY|nr:hypothetical protein DAEQUDRAFT_666537 [Daedalea quercina L-15889]
MSSPTDTEFPRTTRSSLSHPLTTASSSATLVEHFRAGMSSSDIPPVPRISQTTDSDHAAWAYRLSASFGAIAEQINAASQALAAVEVPPSISAPNGDIASTFAHLSARLDAIENTQARIGQELASVIARVDGGRSATAVNRHSETGVEEEPRGAGSVAGSQDSNSLVNVVEALQKKVDELAEVIRLDQTRLYARLRNATITHQKMPIIPLVMANGKTPANFPGTKGEFEHMTKERYEHLLKSYGQPIKGDTIAKREAVREFLGMSQSNV